MFTTFVEKVIAKYSNKQYKNRWYSRGIDPPENLFFFLFDYGLKYGRKCTKEEWSKYETGFTSTMCYCDGYYFSILNGQGTVVHVTKEEASVHI